ncbi:Alcohol dehydrogenase, class IV [Sulfitobacter marinus]|uniref:Alcohol dehydrogenase 2 n=1 Tax=Sulfitobacter marinus TaxID=394264 RepID=A0A1I6R081_9RHOB|nr:Alcohol dehydrogenase, class IV [Sulfitobacter marinus]
MDQFQSNFTFNTVPRIHFGNGRMSEIGTLEAAALGKRCMIITDVGIVATGIVDQATFALSSCGIAYSVFDKVEADPSEATVLAAVKECREADVDSVIGLGGGSSLDVAKLVAYLSGTDEQLDDIYGVGKATGQRLPLVLIPTTSGTGSEVTPIAIVTTTEQEKMGAVSPALLPDAAILDPQLTIGLPPAVTAATGIDAMVHAIEAYTSASSNNNPLSATLALEALRLLGGSLLRAVTHGDDIEARSRLLVGAMLAGQAFANSPVAAVHALAYPIGGHFKVPHGLSNALVLPHVLRFNAVEAPEAYAEMAPAAFPELAAVPASARAAAFCDALTKLSKDCGLPQQLRDLGIGKDSLARMAKDAMNQSRLLVNNPRAVTQADALAIYEAAW